MVVAKSGVTKSRIDWASRVITEYGRDAKGAAEDEGRLHAGVPNEAVKIQARRSVVLASRLLGPGLAVLNDPAGTGKTVVALTAARLLLDGRFGEGAKITKVLILVPNSEVAAVWRTRAEWAGLKTGAPGTNTQIRTMHTARHLGRRGLPAPGKLLVIVDEAHRGLHNKNTAAYKAVSAVASGARLVLVSATPFQLTASGLETMLEIDGKDARGDRIRAYSKSVAGWLRHLHGTNPVSGKRKAPPEVVQALSIAQADLDRILMPSYPRKLMGLPPEMGLPTDPHWVPLGRWAKAYHAARVVPELIRADEAGNARNSDTYMRMIVSSMAAWRASHVYRSAAEAGQPMRSLLKAIEEATGDEPGDHPKVAATARAAADAVEDGNHVLIFCVFLATKSDLRHAVESVLHRRRLRSEVRSADTLHDARDALRRGFGEPVRGRNPPCVLIVSDKLSESVDLDGGRPVVIHHDLSWSPVRWEQRMGRVTRVSTRFQLPPKIIVPILEADADRRMWGTLVGRHRLAQMVVGPKLDLLQQAILGIDLPE